MNTLFYPHIPNIQQENNTQKVIEQVDQKLDHQIQETNNRNEEWRREVQNNIIQQQQEQGEAVKVLKQKIVEVDDRQRTAEQKTCLLYTSQ